MFGSFTLGSMMAGKVANKHDRRRVILCGMLLSAVSIWLLSGAGYDSLLMIWIGLGSFGLCMSFVFIPMIPELEGATKDKVSLLGQSQKIAPTKDHAKRLKVLS